MVCPSFVFWLVTWQICWRFFCLSFFLQNVACPHVVRLTCVSRHFTWKEWQYLTPRPEKLWREFMYDNCRSFTSLSLVFPPFWAASASPEASLDGCLDPHCFISEGGHQENHMASRLISSGGREERSAALPPVCPACHHHLPSALQWHLRCTYSHVLRINGGSHSHWRIASV